VEEFESFCPEIPNLFQALKNAWNELETIKNYNLA
jgi:hypothetical protein